jgi:predicted CoA-binding protein
MLTPEIVLQTKKTYALIGASQDTEKYSYELLVTMIEHGYTVYPINPRYEKIENRPCYASLAHLPEKPEVVIVTLAPRNTEVALNQVAEQNIRTVWLTPGSSSQAALEMAQGFGLEVIHDACPVGLLKMKHTQSKEQ